MTKPDGKITALAGEILKRPLSGEEELEIYRIADAVGMRDIQSFLYLLLVFKLHEDTMKGQFEKLASLEERLNEKFARMGELSGRIDGTLKTSVDKILTDGAKRIGEDMGNAVKEKAAETLASFGEYRSLRGQTMLVCFLCVTSAIAYWLGAVNALRVVPPESALEALLLLPAGWCVFFCGATYTFLWAGDHWGRIKKTRLYKTLLGLQVFFLLILAASLL
jgi:hypothetical protein